ncbi:bifunctional UDP-N-acetylglucosamine diphosphorylase/glucosamine-1-phosphate N-acetyltransferase GlmU [Granulicoccus phenolivorans]|uniref:bifunctional UDP-N-acetylglucosamine diphosphorylase/glucosamine-1-phosphate N-acetyltransferase GlmU n=1 Tax=Granulicoccus phenolivorans TaxID=266854 RepID=UPI00047A9884|nr:bifunctional UDP-N-acetylglucosamine diphosphorylase/glucosamine-1-phosphate N-acetyltransferase GlmU [Granulicoccus phenolivorans]
MQGNSSPVAAVVVLAAGAGTRMKSRKSKLLHEVAGHSMLSYAVAAANAVEPQHVMVVVGHQRDQVVSHLGEIAPNVETTVQAEQLGTGHAVQCALDALGELHGDVVVTYGDVPMLTGETLIELVQAHHARHDAITVLTSRVPNPQGYGRIVRDDDGHVLAIVEDKDTTAPQAQIDEINSGMYVFDAAVLRDGLSRLSTDNAQGELYLTDVLGNARSDGLRVGAYEIADWQQAEGVNDRVQLARMNKEMNRRIVEKWMRAGVSVTDPDSTWIHASVSLSPDVVLQPNVYLEGATSIGEGAKIGPDVTLTDVEVGPGASIVRAQAILAVIGADASVGPYSYLRPGTTLGVGGKIGGFVETKNAKIADGAKVPHLTYAGDAEIGERANIGAGTIFANYDGVAKNTTRIGKDSFVGSNSVLVAPVEVADGAYVAAGSTLTDPVGPGEIAIARGRQANVPGWVAKRRAGTRTAQSAEEALQRDGKAAE